MQNNNENNDIKTPNINSFSRVELLLGSESLERMGSKKVILFGVGV